MGKISIKFYEEDCSGCHSCEVACKQEHGLGVGPRVVRVLEKAPSFKPLFCHHCDPPPCATACPEDAIRMDTGTHTPAFGSRDDAVLGRVDLLALLGRRGAEPGTGGSVTQPDTWV